MSSRAESKDRALGGFVSFFKIRKPTEALRSASAVLPLVRPPPDLLILHVALAARRVSASVRFKVGARRVVSLPYPH